MLRCIHDFKGGKWAEYMDRKDYIIVRNSFKNHIHGHLEGRPIYDRTFFAWNLAKLQRLAKSIPYAKELLGKIDRDEPFL